MSKSRIFVAEVILLIITWGGTTATNMCHGESDWDDPSCTIGNHFFSSILSNLTDNMVLHVPRDVLLSTIVTLEDLENVMILGKNNPVINCGGIGALHFISCNNLTIKGINWEMCGSNNISTYPALNVYNSSNIVIQCSSFQNLAGQAIVLSKVSGDVHISNCTFTHNNEYGGHGAAIHYTTVVGYRSQLLIIDHCNFSFNGVANSLVYVTSPHYKLKNQFHLQASVFSCNQGVSIYLLRHSLEIMGEVCFENNVAPSGVGIFSSFSVVTFIKSNVTLYNNSAKSNGGAIFLHESKLNCHKDSIVKFTDNSAKFGGAIHSTKHSHISFEDNSMLTFNNNSAWYGGGLYSAGYSDTIVHGRSRVKFYGNHATARGGSMHIKDHSNISFIGNSLVVYYKNTASYGGAMSLILSHAFFDENCTLTFQDNHAITYGGSLYIKNHCSLLFRRNSVVTISNSSAKYGGAVYSAIHSIVSFDGNALAVFKGSKAIYGAAIQSAEFSIVLFVSNSKVIFEHNYASRSGGSLLADSNCDTLFDGNSVVNFFNNSATFGGAITSAFHSSISFSGNSVVLFIDNVAAAKAGAVLIDVNCSISFSGQSVIMFYKNTASYGGAVYCEIFSDMLFVENTTVSFEQNHAIISGGSIYNYDHGIVSVGGNSLITFRNNSAKFGGVIYSYIYSTLSFTGNTLVTFEGNYATATGGVAHTIDHCTVYFGGNRLVKFNNNRAKFGGGIYCKSYSTTLFEGNSRVVFQNNSAISGGAIYCESVSGISFKRRASLIFKGNYAHRSGGCIYSEGFSSVSFGEHALVILNGNRATHGGCLYSIKYSNLSINGQSLVTFNNNSAKLGGAVYFGVHSDVSITGISSLTLNGNSASIGGAIYIAKFCEIKLEGNAYTRIAHNIANQGGAIFLSQSNLMFGENSSSWFSYNTAVQSGGAMYLNEAFSLMITDKCYIAFDHNSASFHGGAIYGELIESTQTKIMSNTVDIDFHNNTSIIGPNFYVHVDAACNETCFNRSIAGFKVTHNNPPRQLILYDPAVCIDVDGITCRTYFVDNIMLGQDIKINACVLGFQNEPARRADFSLHGKDKNHSIDGSKLVSVGCNYVEGMRIIGKEVLNAMNFSISIASYFTSESNISINLVAELSLCHAGFQYDPSLQRCVCYNASNAVYCTGSISTIKRGYWFGLVYGQSTVSICPNNYCKFTSFEATNGFYHLSPKRSNQCNSHRSGIACGSCEEGYTLSFDSVECVSINKCNTGQTVLVVTLSTLYWMVTVLIVFGMTYYHIGIGYLYGITYYYSMLDILLNRNSFVSQRLFTAINIISSIFKVTPQFLGQLCFVENMNGIDQQFIHFVHPLAVTVIVVIICQLARMSYRFSAFVSRGIIHVVCFLLLLSYTSVATTSLLLLRSLTFDNVEKSYTYLSPDIEYFHGRHLPYFIVAVVCTILVVIGPPLLLFIEPFLNSRINFIQIKPLLDHFQGCFKDTRRWFSSYYMICRLVIISIIIANSTNNNTTSFLLVASTTMMALIHVVFKPYKRDLLNIFDGIILHLMILVAVLPLVDNFHSGTSLEITLILLILPSINFIMLELIVHKEGILNIAKHFISKSINTNNNKDEIPASDIGIIVDDNMRKNATVCEM